MAIQDIQDLLSFPIKCPKLYREFEGGDSVVQISGSQFSRIHYDQPKSKAVKNELDCASDKLQNRKEITGPKIEENVSQVESKILAKMGMHESQA